MIGKSFRGVVYFVSFINDYFRKIYATCLKFKDQVIDVFNDLYTKVEIEINKKLKCVQINNCGEYTSLF